MNQNLKSNSIDNEEIISNAIENGSEWDLFIEESNKMSMDDIKEDMNKTAKEIRELRLIVSDLLKQSFKPISLPISKSSDDLTSKSLSKVKSIKHKSINDDKSSHCKSAKSSKHGSSSIKSTSESNQKTNEKICPIKTTKSSIDKLSLDSSHRSIDSKDGNNNSHMKQCLKHEKKCSKQKHQIQDKNSLNQIVKEPVPKLVITTKQKLTNSTEALIQKSPIESNNNSNQNQKSSNHSSIVESKKLLKQKIDTNQSIIEQLKAICNAKIQSKIVTSSKVISYEINFLKNLRYSAHSIQKPKFANENELQNFNHIINSSELSFVKNSYPLCFDSIQRAWRLSCDLIESSIKTTRDLLDTLNVVDNIEDSIVQFVNLKFVNDYDFIQLVDLIYDKAIDDPTNCELIVRLMKSRPQIIISNNQTGEKIIGRLDVSLMQKCKICFDAYNQHKLNQDRRQKEITKCKDEGKKKYLIEYLNMEIKLFENKNLNNIRLIAELYKYNSLYGIFVDSCIDQLIVNDDENSYECLCLLLKLIGEKFEKNTKNKNKFIEQMKRIQYRKNCWKSKDQLRSYFACLSDPNHSTNGFNQRKSVS